MGYKLRLWGLLLAFSPALWATPLCSDTTLNNYTALGTGGCQIGNAIFSNFNYNYTLGDTVDPAVSSSDVTVSVGGSLFSPELTFQTSNPSIPWQASDGFQTQFYIVYTVTVPTTTPIEDSSVDFTGTVQNNGGLPSNITSQFSFSSTGATLTPFLYPANCGPAATSCTSTVSGEIGLNNLLQVTVEDLITLDSAGTANSSLNVASVSEFDQTFGEVPEPSTLLVLGLGLLACAVAVVRQARRAGNPLGN
ncbi:MAG TPA: PEP-CTERM sorting domain-containing protein [Bryobacteraceae bacterium]|nr:PEP-CTERM sorting domain-containing protein [Bryobacteraceae bacterium]